MTAMNDREKMLADLRMTLRIRDYGDEVDGAVIADALVAFVDDHRAALEAILTEPTLEEVLAELAEQEFFHDGLAGDLHDVPDKAHAYRIGWDECIQAASECLRRVKE